MLFKKPIVLKEYVISIDDMLEKDPLFLPETQLRSAVLRSRELLAELNKQEVIKTIETALSMIQESLNNHYNEIDAKIKEGSIPSHTDFPKINKQKLQSKNLFFRRTKEAPKDMVVSYSSLCAASSNHEQYIQAIMLYHPAHMVSEQNRLVRELKKYAAQHDGKLPEAKSYEFFAAITLERLRHCAHCFINKWLWAAWDSALTAMEFLSYADCHKLIEKNKVKLGEVYERFEIEKQEAINDALENLNKTISAQRVKAAKMRHSGTDQLKQNAIQLFKQKEYKSIRQASLKIFPMIQQYAKEKNISPLSNDTGQKTLYNWLLDSNKPEKDQSTTILEIRP